MASEQRRLTVNISRHLDKNIARLARAQGLTKSTLVRKFINVTSPEITLTANKNKSKNKQTLQYTLRLNQAEWSILENLATKNNLALSGCVRALLQRAYTNIIAPKHTNNSIPKKPANAVKDKLQTLWLNVNAGQLTQAQVGFGEVEDILGSTSIDAWPYAHIYLSRGLYARHVRNLRQAEKMFHASLELASAHGLNDVKMMAFSQLGVLADLRGEVWQAVSYNLQAQELAQSQSDNVEELKIILRLANLAGYQQDSKRVNDYVAAAHQRAGDDVMRLWNRLAVSQIRLGHFAKAEEILQQSLAQMQTDENKKITESRYCLEDLAVCVLARGEKQQAKDLFTQAEYWEAHLRRPVLFGKARLYRLFIGAEDNFNDNYRQMEQMVEYQLEPVYEQLGRYILYSAEFLFGDASEIEKGERRLREMAADRSNPMIAAAAAHTLQTKSLRPIV
jgi:hypothetical protein